MPPYSPRGSAQWTPTAAAQREAGVHFRIGPRPAVPPRKPACSLFPHIQPRIPPPFPPSVGTRRTGAPAGGRWVLKAVAGCKRGHPPLLSASRQEWPEGRGIAYTVHEPRDRMPPPSEDGRTHSPGARSPVRLRGGGSVRCTDRRYTHPICGPCPCPCAVPLPPTRTFTIHSTKAVLCSGSVMPHALPHPNAPWPVGGRANDVLSQTLGLKPRNNLEQIIGTGQSKKGGRGNGGRHGNPCAYLPRSTPATRGSL